MSNENDIYDLFLNTKPVDLLLQLAKPNARHYASALSKDADVTYSHAVKCIQQFDEFELVEFQKKGRRKEINLTEKGEKLADRFSELRKSVRSETSSSEGSLQTTSI